MSEETLPPVDTAVPAPTDVLVERWFVDHFYNVSGLTTEMFNRFRTAADDLKARLRQEQ